MKKIITILIATILLFTIVGCGKKEEKKENKNNEVLRIELKDGIKAKAKIADSVNSQVVRINFNRQKEGSKVAIKLGYYKKNKKVYEDNIIYIFPAKDVDCMMEIPIQKEVIVLKDPLKYVDPKDYNDQNTTKQKIEYDYLKLEIKNNK